MRKVIVNSTPLIALCKVGALDVLKRLYGEITIPEAVYREILFKRDSACQQVQENGDWIKLQRIRNDEARGLFEASLHAGEVETMILALESPPALVVMDDYKARQKARTLGLTFTGTLGVLLRAKAENIVPKVAPLLFKLKEQGIYITDRVLEQALQTAGE